MRNNTVRDAYHTWADVSPSGKPGFKGGPSIAVNAAPCAIDEKPSGESCTTDVKDPSSPKSVSRVAAHLTQEIEATKLCCRIICHQRGIYDCMIHVGLKRPYLHRYCLPLQVTRDSLTTLP